MPNDRPIRGLGTRSTLCGPLYSFSCIHCGSYVSDERPSEKLAATNARGRGAIEFEYGFVHKRCLEAHQDGTGNPTV